jgi:hypothetical protein
MAISFIECTSLNIAYDIMGRVTLSYTVVHDEGGIVPFPDGTTGSIIAGGRTFQGFVANASMNQIPNTLWYETHVTFIAVAN